MRLALLISRRFEMIYDPVDPHRLAKRPEAGAPLLLHVPSPRPAPPRAPLPLPTGRTNTNTKGLNGCGRCGTSAHCSPCFLSFHDNILFNGREKHITRSPPTEIISDCSVGLHLHEWNGMVVHIHIHTPGHTAQSSYRWVCPDDVTNS